MDVGINNALSAVTAGSKSRAVSVASSAVLPPAASLSVESASVIQAAEKIDPAKEPGREPVEQAIASIQGFVQAIRRELSFDLDDSSGRVVVKVTDAVSGDVIRQIPSEDALKLAENLQEVRSLLFKAEA